MNVRAFASLRLERRWVWAVALWGGVVGLLLLSHLPYLRQPLDRDSATYATIAEHLRGGLLPYRDLFDHKQPVIYLAYLIDAVGGTVAIRIASALLVGAAALMIGHVMAMWSSRRRALLSVVMFVILASSESVQGSDLNVDHLLAAITVCGLAAIASRVVRERPAQPVMVGLWAAAMLLTRINAFPLVVVGVAWAVSAIDRRARPPYILRITGWLLLPVAGVAVFFWWNGALGDLFFANVVYNLRYVGSIEQGGGVFAASTLPVWGLASIAGGVLAVRAHARPRDVVVRGLVWWLVAAVVVALSARRFFPHYLAVVVAPSCVAVAWGIRRRGVGAVMTTCVAALLALAAVPYGQAYRSTPSDTAVRIYGEQARAWRAAEVIGAFVRTRDASEPARSMFVIGSEPGFYRESGLLPPTRYLYDYPRRYVDGFDEGIRQQLRSDPPTYVIAPRGVGFGSYATVLTGFARVFSWGGYDVWERDHPGGSAIRR